MTFYRLAVLGDPVAHSRSPQIHSEMLSMTGLNGEYQKIEADAAVLKSCLSGLRIGEWQGLNITMPLKAEAALLADELDPSAAGSGSVNTLVSESGAIRGYSTDTLTFRSLLTLPEMGTASSILVLGAGGSAAAALAAAEGWDVYVSARRFDRAEELCKRMQGQPLSWGTVVAGAVVINATPVGMDGESLPDGILEAAGAVIDLPYGDQPTPVVERARALGLPIREGHEFLVRQAVDSFYLWTGIRVDLDALLRRLRKTLRPCHGGPIPPESFEKEPR